jgi:thioredoxin 1
MLYTNLKHIESAAEHSEIVNENEHVMVICGRMGTQCIPVYGAAEELESEFPHVKIYDIEFDNPESHVIRELFEVQNFRNVPFVIYYRKGEIVKATSGIQTKLQIKSILENEFDMAVKA